MKEYGSVTDDGGQTYKTVEIGTQTWFQRNLNYAVTGSKCYGSREADCATYGRLYDWATAMTLSTDCKSTSCSSQVDTKHRGICPSGWHIPSDAEWTILTNYVGTNAGTKLKATSDWTLSSDAPSGTDAFGFSALPGGNGCSTGGYGCMGPAGNVGLWWSTSEGIANEAYSWHMSYLGNSVSRNGRDKSYFFSVRCLKD